MIERKRISMAILAKCRKVLTGREIDVCERAKSGELDEDEAFLQEYDDDEEALDEDDAISSIRSDIQLFKSLEIQFSREISEWKGRLV